MEALQFKYYKFLLMYYSSLLQLQRFRIGNDSNPVTFRYTFQSMGNTGLRRMFSANSFSSTMLSWRKGAHHRRAALAYRWWWPSPRGGRSVDGFGHTAFSVPVEKTENWRHERPAQIHISPKKLQENFPTKCAARHLKHNLKCYCTAEQVAV